MRDKGQRTRQILLLDCDAMFCEVARLVDPHGAGLAKELVVGGKRNSRGVVCSASYGARAKGVHAGMPLGMAERLCPEAMFVPVPREAVATKSAEVEEILKNWTPDVEAASVDEFYLDMTGMEQIYKGMTFRQMAERIRSDVMEKAGIPVSLGGATNKLLAKMAVEDAKPRKGGNGVFIIEPGGEEAWMETRALKDIPGVGPKAQERYGDAGWTTVKDIKAAGREEIILEIGSREGGWLWDVACGRDDSVLTTDREAKSVSHETTFPRDVHKPEVMRHYLKTLSAHVGSEIRDDRLKARTVTVRARDNTFKTKQASKTTKDGICTDEEIYRLAVELLDKLRLTNRRPLRLLGVGLSNFISDETLELGITPNRDRQISDVLDRIRARHGSGVAGYGAEVAVSEKRPNRKKRGTGGEA